ncbi:PaaX family transcriptional regulator C-terminal domain-containing protein [Aneurinibacillus tyrosinisolvens]
MERTQLVYDYCKLLYEDPRLPLDLLPADWNRIKARELF